MKIYFAGSITGGRGDQGLYAEIIKMLNASYGTVLTEHIGEKKLDAGGEVKLSAQEICERDLDWVREADALVAEITNPSLGVGYEIGFAEALKKPMICLYRDIEGKRVSAMLCGNKNVRTQKYEKLEDLPAIFDEFFKTVTAK